MPTYPVDIQTKLNALQALTGADRRPAEMCAIYWPAPTGTTIYSSAMYTQLPWWPDLAAAIESYFGDPIPITLTLIPDGTPFIDLPRAASISDDSINLTFDDNDNAFSGLLMAYGEGIRTEVFCYWPAVDLLLSMWRGMLHQPKDMNRDTVKITATSGWRAPQMLVPKRPHATSCPFIFGALLSSQAEIDYHNGCPFNRHVGGTIGNPAFIGGDCPRRVKADCSERLTEDDGVTPTERYWPGFETRPDAIPNNQTSGPNLLAKAIGNESNLSDPIRVIAGERHIKALNLLAFRIEEDTNHPEDGFGAALFEMGEGHLLALWEFRINGQIVGAEHFQLRLGALGQQPTDWSPDVNSYSGTAHGYGRIQGDFRNAQASDFNGSVRALGSDEVRVYSDPDTYVESYTTNRVWWILRIQAEARWGYGQDYPRFDIQSFIDAAAWCDEFVTLTDTNGNEFTGTRSTFNAEVTARAIQQQVKDICTAGRLGIPFEFEGKDVIVPLRAEDVDDPAIPLFTDEGSARNIVYDGPRSSLSWSVISDESMTNQWTVNFDDAANSGVDTQFIFGDQAQQLRAGRAWGDRSKRVVNKSQAGYGINSAQEAARFGNSLLYLGPLDSGGILNPFSVKFITWYSEAFNVQNYKLIKVVNAKLQSRMSAYFTARGIVPYPDADYTCFRVMKYTRKGDLRVEIEAQQYATLEESPAEPEVARTNIYLVGFDTAKVWKINGEDFAEIEELTITEPVSLGGTFGPIAVDDSYVYTAMTNGTSEVHRIQIADWTTVEHAVVGVDGNSNTDTVILQDESYIYTAFDNLVSNEIIRIVRLHKSDFSTTDVLTVVSPGGGIFNMVQDDNFLYVLDTGNFSPSTNDKAIKISKSSFTVSATIDLGAAQTIAYAAVMDQDDTYVYIAWNAGNVVKRIQKATWASATSHSIGAGLNARYLMCDRVNGRLWIAMFGAHHIRVYETAGFTEIQTVDLAASESASKMAQDANFVYILQPESSPPTVTKVSKADYSQTVFNTDLGETFIYTMAVGSISASTTFGPPRNLTAVVNAVTGLVHFHWSPPTIHPELVTGYALYESDGVTVAMPTDLVYNFELTLAPGEYTYKLNATDGVTVSAFISVTFTVPEPPVTGVDLFLVDDPTLENILDDLTLEQITD